VADDLATVDELVALEEPAHRLAVLRPEGVDDSAEGLLVVSEASELACALQYLVEQLTVCGLIRHHDPPFRLDDTADRAAGPSASACETMGSSFLSATACRKKPALGRT
jgi:hypothetical protein